MAVRRMRRSLNRVSSGKRTAQMVVPTWLATCATAENAAEVAVPDKFVNSGSAGVDRDKKRAMGRASISAATRCTAAPVTIVVRWTRSARAEFAPSAASSLRLSVSAPVSRRLPVFDTAADAARRAVQASAASRDAALALLNKSVATAAALISHRTRVIAVPANGRASRTRFVATVSALAPQGPTSVAGAASTIGVTQLIAGRVGGAAGRSKFVPKVAARHRVAPKNSSAIRLASTFWRMRRIAGAAIEGARRITSVVRARAGVPRS